MKTNDHFWNFDRSEYFDDGSHKTPEADGISQTEYITNEVNMIDLSKVAPELNINQMIDVEDQQITDKEIQMRMKELLKGPKARVKT